MADQQQPYHHKDLRRHLIDTAREIIATEGVASLTMRELSQRNNVSRMAAYRHFKDKHDLLCAVAEEGFLAIAERYEACIAAHQDQPVETLLALGRIYVQSALECPPLYRLMFGPLLTRRERPPSLREAARRAFGHLLATVELCQDLGLLRPGSSQALASLLWSMMHGFASLLMDGQLQTEGCEDGFPVLLTDNLGKLPKEPGKLLDLASESMLWGLAPTPGDHAR